MRHSASMNEMDRMYSQDINVIEKTSPWVHPPE